MMLNLEKGKYLFLEFYRCIYIQNKVAFELEIEVIPDYNDLKKDIVDVLEVIDETPDGLCLETLRQKVISIFQILKQR